jgi:hypothetical protein
MKSIIVFERVATGNIAAYSFSETKSGNKYAEEKFVAIAKDNGFTDIDIEDGLNDGYLDDSHNGGDWELYLTHVI